jgi:hypothetical protein
VTETVTIPREVLEKAGKALETAEDYYARLPPFPDRYHDIEADLRLIRAALSALREAVRS